MPFFKGREVRMRFVKTNTKDETDQSVCDESHDPEVIAEIAKDVVTHVAATVGAVFIVCRLSVTACRVIETIAKAATR